MHHQRSQHIGQYHPGLEVFTDMCVNCLILRTAWILDKNIWVYAPQEEKLHSYLFSRGHRTTVVYDSPHYGKSDLGQEHSGAGKECRAESWRLECSQQEWHAPETAGVVWLLAESTLTYCVCGFGPPAAGLSSTPRGHKGCPEKTWLPSPYLMECKCTKHKHRLKRVSTPQLSIHWNQLFVMCVFSIIYCT